MPKKQEPKNLFPHSMFPFRLEYTDKLSGENVICWFTDKVYRDKHIKRYKLKKNSIRTDERDKPTKPKTRSRKKSTTT
tara:strand:+ start:63 stop:296 length:234 start_codon:yes stop_codon:yes gene_type:complete